MNLKIGATKKVPVMHRGAMDFSNQACWGQEYDEALVTESQIPWKFPTDIDGWLFPEEGKALADLSAGKRVLEIGSYCGLSTVCIARTAKSVTAVDYFDGRATPVPGSTFEQFTNNLKRYGVDQKVNILHPEAVVPGPVYDLVFIDGDHSAEAVRKDIETALNVLRPGGLIAFHDYRRDRQEFADPAFDEGVTESVNELISLGGEMIARHKTLAIVRPPQLVSNPA